MSDADVSHSATHFVIDAISDGVAFLVARNDDALSFYMPCAALPPGAREGDHLRVTIAFDLESRAKNAERVKSLLKDLTADSDPNQTEFQL
jgi:hypothetical protein